MSRRALCELHLHLYGCIRWRDWFDRLCAARLLGWQKYAADYEAAFAAPSPIPALVEAARRGEQVDAEAFRRAFLFGEPDAGNFARFQAKFGLLFVGSELALSRPDNAPWTRALDELEAIARMILEDQSKEGLGYAEQRFRPGPASSPELARATWQRLLEVYHEHEGPLTARLAPSLPREDPWPQWAITKQLALGSRGEALTGVDFCHVEEGYPPKQLATFFADLKAFNVANPERALALLYHVGESFEDKSLESAIRWVQEAAEAGAHRLGHAIALGVDPARFGQHTREERASERRDQIRYDLAHQRGLESHGVTVDRDRLEAELRSLDGLSEEQRVTRRYGAAELEALRRRQDYAMERVRATGAVIEVCPASNRRIGGITNSAHHPVHRFLERGLRVVVASDDPGIMGVRLADELDWVVQEAGLDAGGRAALEQAAWDSRSEVLSGRVAAARAAPLAG